MKIKTMNDTSHISETFPIDIFITGTVDCLIIAMKSAAING